MLAGLEPLSATILVSLFCLLLWVSFLYWTFLLILFFVQYLFFSLGSA